MNALRIARREMRGGLRSFRIFLLCLILGVAAIAAVGSIRLAVTTGLVQEGARILGGDAEMEFTYRFATDDERVWMDQNAHAVSQIVDFRSMAVVDKAGETERALIQIKAVDDAYPLYGTVELEPAIALPEAIAGNGMVAERVLVDRLGLKIGDEVVIGEAAFELRAILLREPDTAVGGFGLGPRVILRTGALEGSGLIQPGSLFETDYRLALREGTDLAALEEDARNRFEPTGLRWRDKRNGSPGTARFVERMGSFLVIVGLAGLAVGGIGVSAAVRAYLDGKIDTIATLKTLGATGNTIFAAYFMQIGALAVLGVAVGLIIGGGVPALLGPTLSAVLPVPANFAIYPRPLAEAALYGLLTAAIFTLWPLARARDIRAAGLFRDLAEPGRRWPSWPYIAITGVLIAALIGSAAWASGIPALALWSAFGIVAALVILVLAAALIRILAGHLSRSRLLRGRPALRLAFGAVGGPGGESNAVVLSLGLGLTVLATIGQIDANLRGAIAGELLQITPAYFVVDIQSDQRDDFLATAQETGQVEQIDTAPMLRGVITEINGTNAREVAGEHWVLRGDRGVTYGDTPPKGATITDGTWWEPGYSGKPLVSFAQEEGVELGLSLGDTITVNILGRNIEAEIANFRVVDFSNMGINFILMLNEAALAGAPHSHIATIYAPQEAEAPILRAIANRFPNITAIRTRDAIERAVSTVRAIAAATSWIAAATLLTGFMVLIGAAAAGERARVFEAAILKTLGAARGLILRSFALRAALLGTAAGIVAILAAALAGWAVMTFVMETDYQFEPLSALLIVVGGACVNVIAGLVYAIRPLSARPAHVLRTRD